MNKKFDELKKKKRVKVDKYHTTHLYLNDKGLQNIGNISNFSNLSVLYLHNNSIQDISKLSTVKTLTYLYLQWNRIISLTNLNNLPNLKNLYLGYNYISLLDGLNSMPNLQVLHIQRQNVINQCSIEFDFDTISSLSESLIELNVSGNGLTTLENLQSLSNLIIVDMSNNLLADMKNVCDTMKKWRRLKNLRIAGNIVSKTKKYEFDIISVAFRLDFINDKPVPNTVRIFLQALREVKSKRERMKEQKPKTVFSLETRNYMQQLPLEFREIVSRSIIHNRGRKN